MANCFCFYFQVHQPFRMARANALDIKGEMDYFDDERNRNIAEKVARNCYLPANRTFLDLIQRYEGRVKINYSISGVALEQFSHYVPEVLESFKELARTGCVEFLCETYYHSLSFLFSWREFEEQVDLHRRKIKELFGQEPKVFRNTELIYSDALAKKVSEMGFSGILAEGIEYVLGGRFPTYVYRARGTDSLKVLLRHYRLSDDIGFRFSNRGWWGWPLTADKFSVWAGVTPGDIINIFIDYETFGEHQWRSTGIFQFIKALPKEIFKNPDARFLTVSEAINELKPVGEFGTENWLSWADIERDLSAWCGNALQNEALAKLYRLEDAVKKTSDPQIIQSWRKLTTSDHYYYMCTKWFSDGDVHKYFNPHHSPYQAYINMMIIQNHLYEKLKSRGVAPADW